jgi:hypothetical protein
VRTRVILEPHDPDHNINVHNSRCLSFLWLMGRSATIVGLTTNSTHVLFCICVCLSCRCVVQGKKGGGCLRLCLALCRTAWHLASGQQQFILRQTRRQEEKKKSNRDPLGLKSFNSSSCTFVQTPLAPLTQLESPRAESSRSVLCLEAVGKKLGGGFAFKREKVLAIKTGNAIIGLVRSSEISLIPKIKSYF